MVNTFTLELSKTPLKGALNNDDPQYKDYMPTSEFVITTQKSSYQIKSVLGIGQFGVVYEAEDLSTGETVAVKYGQIQNDMQGNQFQEAVKSPGQSSYETERKTLEKTGQLIDTAKAGSTHGKDYDDMEHQEINILPLYKGQTLEKLLKQKDHLTPEDMLKLLKNISLAFHKFGQLAIVHGDIKSDNIIVDPVTLEVKICDFGENIHLQDLDSFVTQDELIGNLEHAPPEASKDKDKIYSLQSDVFGVGILLWEIISELSIDDRKRQISEHQDEELKAGALAKMAKEDIVQEIQANPQTQTDFDMQFIANSLNPTIADLVKDNRSERGRLLSMVKMINDTEQLFHKVKSQSLPKVHLKTYLKLTLLQNNIKSLILTNPKLQKIDPTLTGELIKLQNLIANLDSSKPLNLKDDLKLLVTIVRIESLAKDSKTTNLIDPLLSEIKNDDTILNFTKSYPLQKLSTLISIAEKHQKSTSGKFFTLTDKHTSLDAKLDDFIVKYQVYIEQLESSRDMSKYEQFLLSKVETLLTELPSRGKGIHEIKGHLNIIKSDLEHTLSQTLSNEKLELDDKKVSFEESLAEEDTYSSQHSISEDDTTPSSDSEKENTSNQRMYVREQVKAKRELDAARIHKNETSIIKPK